MEFPAWSERENNQVWGGGAEGGPFPTPTKVGQFKKISVMQDIWWLTKSKLKLQPIDNEQLSFFSLGTIALDNPQNPCSAMLICVTDFELRRSEAELCV